MKKIILMMIIITSIFAFPAKVKKIVDGDTITVVQDNGIVSKIRFADVDTPEKFLISKKAQYDIKKCGKVTFEMGKSASIHLGDLLKVGELVDVNLTGTKSHERDVGIISKNGINLNKQMVVDGYAIVWHTGRDMTDQSYKEDLLNVQNEAIFNKYGFWGTKAREISCLMDYHK